ncbi:MAG: J domain-containing protein [Myxococcota bacterium]
MGCGRTADDLLAELLRGRGMAEPPGDAHAELALDFRSAVVGGSHELGFDDGRRITVRIPPGVRDGETIRLAGQGTAGRGGAGDLWIALRVGPHPVFRRDGEDLHVDVPITVGEAIRGGTVPVPTPTGTVELKVPAGTQSGRTLRVRDRGVTRRGQPPGHLYVHVVVQVPEGADERAVQAIEASYPGDVRESLFRRAAA